MRKPAFCICENKAADQLCGNRTALQHLCFRYTDSAFPSSSYILNFKPLDISCGCIDQFVWDLVRNPKDWFSHNEAHISPGLPRLYRSWQYGHRHMEKIGDPRVGKVSYMKYEDPREDLIEIQWGFLFK